MEEKKISEQESLFIIQQMIQTAKAEQKDDGKGWIIWGWLIFLASIFTYFNLQIQWLDVFFFWNMFGLVTLVLLLYKVVEYFFGKKRYRVKTYTNDLLKKLNFGFIIFLVLIIFSMNLGRDPIRGFALLLGLYGFWILIYGTLLNFKPSIIGAYITWALAFASMFVSQLEWTMLLHAIAVLFGYIIPGHIAYREFNKVKH